MPRPQPRQHQQPTKRGRPTLPAGQACSARIDIALAPIDKTRWEAAAARDGVNLSQWLKGLADKRDAETIQ